MNIYQQTNHFTEPTVEPKIVQNRTKKIYQKSQMKRKKEKRKKENDTKNETNEWEWNKYLWKNYKMMII